MPKQGVCFQPDARLPDFIGVGVCRASTGLQEEAGIASSIAIIPRLEDGVSARATVENQRVICLTDAVPPLDLIGGAGAPLDKNPVCI